MIFWDMKDTTFVYSTKHHWKLDQSKYRVKHYYKASWFQEIHYIFMHEFEGENPPPKSRFRTGWVTLRGMEPLKTST